MSSSAGKSTVFEFPASKAGRPEKAPAWFTKSTASASRALFARSAGSGPEPERPHLDAPPVPRHPAATRNKDGRFPGPPPVPSIDTPPPGSKSQPPPPMDNLHAAATAELQRSRQAFAEAALELAAARAKVLKDMEGGLIDLAIEMAAAIIDKEVEADPELHRRLAEEALKALGDREHATLRASHAAVDAIIEGTGQPVVEIDGVKVKIEADAAIEGLGCVAENEHVRVDARVSERLRTIRRAIEDERRLRGRQETE